MRLFQLTVIQINKGEMMRIRKAVLYLMITLVLSACIYSPGVDDELTETVNSGKRKKANPAVLPKIPDAATLAIKELNYNLSDARSPFEVAEFALAATEPVTPEDGEAIDVQRYFDPRRQEGYVADFLEGYEINMLKMVGALRSNSGDYVALIKLPEGLIYQASVGEHMGKNFGKIIQINEQFVELSEVSFLRVDEWSERLRKVLLETVPLK